MAKYVTREKKVPASGEAKHYPQIAPAMPMSLAQIVNHLSSMKRIYTAIAMSLILAHDVMGQTITDHIELGYPNNIAISIPKEFSHGNTPLITMHDNTEDQNLLVYDENLDLVKTIKIKNDKTFDYQLTYQDEMRDVLSVTERDKESLGQFDSYEEFIQKEMMYEPSFNESQLHIVKQENGDSIITYDYSYSKWGTNEQMYLGYSYFGMKYPKVYWVCSKGIVYGYRATYSVTYTNWQVTGTHTENKQVALNRIRLCNINLNQGDGRANYYFEASQTLFNEDEEFEYLIPKYKLSATGDVNNPEQNGQEIVTSRTTLISEESDLSLAGFQIAAADGSIIEDMTFDNDFEGSIDLDYAYVITIGQTTYLAFNGYSNGEEHTIFYKIDRSTSGIKQVMKAPATMMLSPTIVNRNATIKINFNDGNKDGSEIVMVSAAGMTVDRFTVPKEQASAQIDVAAPAGLYCVSRVQKSKVTNTQKIIIK